jgi:hypothetical protein
VREMIAAPAAAPRPAKPAYPGQWFVVQDDVWDPTSLDDATLPALLGRAAPAPDHGVDLVIDALVEPVASPVINPVAHPVVTRVAGPAIDLVIDPAQEPPLAPPRIAAMRTSTRLALSAQTGTAFGGYLNGGSFQQDGLLSFNGYQYAAYWNADAQVMLARRPGGEGPWMQIQIARGCVGRRADVHQPISMGVSPRDGRLHIAFDHYDGDLRHVQSVPDLLTRPHAAAWEAASFGPVSSQLGSQLVQRLTYPRFVTAPDGRLLLSYRRGTTGDGDEALWEYDGATGSWTELGAWLTGSRGGASAYLHGLEFHGKRLHAAWCWRTSHDPSTNHDLMYAYSDDNGRNWCNSAGEPVGSAGVSPATRSSDLRVWQIEQHRGLANQEHMIVDPAGRVHVLASHLADTDADDADYLRARDRCRYFHYWRDLGGTWYRAPMHIAAAGTRRGKLAVSAAGNLYAVLPGLRIACASAASRWTDWALVDTELDGQFLMDPKIDRQQLRSSNRLTVLASTVNSNGVGRIDTLGYQLD